MGRAPYKLGYLYKKYPAKKFFNEYCKEELTRDWHVHVDNYGNYMVGYCGGISLGFVVLCAFSRQCKGEQMNLKSLIQRSFINT